MSKYLDFSKSIFALFGLFSVITLSIVTVLALNPKEYQSINTDPISTVLGETTSRNIMPLVLLDLNDQSIIKSSLKLTNSEVYDYTVNLNSINAPYLESKFIKIENPNDTEAKLSIQTSIQAESQDNLKINMIDNLDELILYTPVQRSITREITIPGQSSRTFDIKYLVNQNINFPTKIVFTIILQ